MKLMVTSFKDLTPELQVSAGGKGGMLASMLQAGYPVPDGFVILPSAFQGDKLRPQAWKEIQAKLNTMRQNHPGTLFAVRSSALNEDSAQASFAGEFETVLNVSTDEAIAEAIDTVYKSGESERVKVYSSVHGITSHQVAVVVQYMVPSEVSGVLFTADPVSGSLTRMTGNFVYGLGEQLVAGEANPSAFTFTRPRGTYEGPHVMKKYASRLYALAAKLEKKLGSPQDIEWAIAKGTLYLLQARPITTLSTGNPDTYEWNDSLTGDFLWTNTNIGEAFADVFTPFSWSVIRALDEEQSPLPGYYLFSGNIAGRAYSNLSYGLSLLPAFGINIKRGIGIITDVFGELPKRMTIPVYPMTALGALKAAAPRVKIRMRKFKESFEIMPQYLQENPDWCTAMTARIGNVASKNDLIALWKNELLPHNFKALWVALAGGRKMVIASKLRKKLVSMLGTEDANTLLSNFRGDAALESLGPVTGISNILKGELSREEYRRRYGHRGPHEFELSIPDPGESDEWLDKQIDEFKASDTDVEGHLRKQKANYEAARKRLEDRLPRKAGRIGETLAKVGEAARLRESVRSEWTRVFRVNRAFALRAGLLAGIGEDVFFLYIDEALKLLAGDASALKHVPARKETYRKYKSLPPLPSLIRGRFEPFKWAEEPNRRVDFYDPTVPIAAPDSQTLKGFAGAAGRVEGRVRILTAPEEGEQFQAGEILVASTTNVGWTPLFPRAAAVITDIGAPLSHAAIVARELGIPAVVGCGNATVLLKTGDRVIVDGGQGIIQLLERSSI